MKNTFVIIFIMISCISFYACKKCYTCTPKCLKCTKLSSKETVCRTAYDNVDDFNNYLNTLTGSGYACTEIDTTITEEDICGNSSSVAAANASTKASDGYNCILKK